MSIALQVVVVVIITWALLFYATRRIDRKADEELERDLREIWGDRFDLRYPNGLRGGR